jgi:hypothetical protein
MPTALLWRHSVQVMSSRVCKCCSCAWQAAHCCDSCATLTPTAGRQLAALPMPHWLAAQIDLLCTRMPSRLSDCAALANVRACVTQCIDVHRHSMSRAAMCMLAGVRHSQHTVAACSSRAYNPEIWIYRLLNAVCVLACADEALTTQGCHPLRQGIGPETFGDPAPFIVLRLTDSNATRATWPHGFELLYKVWLGGLAHVLTRVSGTPA